MNWLVRISNTHREASIKEIEALLPQSELTWINPLLVLVDEDKNEIDMLLQRSASVKWIMHAPEIIEYSNNPLDIIMQHPLTNISIDEISGIGTFAARFTQLLMRNPEMDKRVVEREIGAKILKQLPDLDVNLTEPDAQYRIVLTMDKLVFGWIYQFTSFETISSRSPKESLFFGGGAMKPMLSKILVNLLEPLSPVILDPFCGHGGFMREISATQNYAIGVEISWKISRENKINNDFHNEDHIEIIAGDALHLPFRQNAIYQAVTDPPYAKQSTTIGRDREDVVELWLHNATQKTIIMTLPSDMEINIPQDWYLEYEISDYVHKSLTRIIRKVIKRK